MASEINIRIGSSVQTEGFKKAEEALTALEEKYKNVSAVSDAQIKKTLNNIPKMAKAAEAIFKNGGASAAEDAGLYFQNWARALINNFSGGDAGKLRNQLEKAMSTFMNIVGSDNMKFVGTTQLQKELNDVAKIYNQVANDTYSASTRKQMAFEKEQVVLQALGLETEAYSAKLSYLKEQMMSMGVITDDNREEFEKLADQYKKTSQELDTLTKEQNKNKGGFGQYIGMTLKSMLTHQILAKAIKATVQLFKDSTQAAAQAEQIMNKLNTVYEGFGKTAQKTAKQLASSIGVANSTASSALSTVGDLLQAQGMGVAESLKTATEWVSRFQDIIAFKDLNMSLEEFAQAFMAGAAGNTRNFRTFGSIVKESAVQAELAKKGLDNLTGSQLELEKMTIRANLALEQQANSVGATEREWDTTLSVNRRLAEAQKQMKENLGEILNQRLLPIKRAWTDILEQTNKSIKASQEYAKGNEDVQVYDIVNNDKDRISFENKIRDLFRSLTTNDEYSVISTEGDGAIAAQQVKSLNEQIVKFGATVKDVTKILGDKLTPEVRELLLQMEEERKERLRQIKLREERGASLASLTSGYDIFTEALKSITGVDISTPDWGSRQGNFNVEGGVELYAQNIANSLHQGVLASLKSLKALSGNDDDLKKTWGDVISGQLDELNKGDLLQGVADSYRMLFENAWNEFKKDGLSDQEIKDLHEIKDSYLEAKDALDEYNKALEAQQGLLSYGQDYLTSVATKNAIGTTDSFGNVLTKDNAGAWVELQRKISEVNKMFADMKTSYIEIDGQLVTQSLIIQDLKNKYLEEIDVVDKTKTAFEKWAESWKNMGISDSFTSAIQNSTGGQIVEAGINGATAGGFWGAIIGILSEILSHTEAFGELLALAEPIVEIMDSFIRPLVPALTVITDILNLLVYSLLAPFFPILKDIAKIIAYVAIPIKIAANIIYDIFAVVNNIFQWITHPFSGGNQMALKPINEGVDEILETIRSINDMTFEIKKNTAKGDDALFKAYTEMFEKQMITASEYYALLAGLNGIHYDNMRTYDGYAWQNGTGGTTMIYYGDLKFTIDGTNLSAEEIAEAIERILNNKKATGQYA